VQTIDVEAAAQLVDHSITVAGINKDEHDNPTTDDVSFIQQRIDQFKARNSTNGNNNDELMAKLMSDVAETNINERRSNQNNQSRRVEVDIPINEHKASNTNVNQVSTH